MYKNLAIGNIFEYHHRNFGEVGIAQAQITATRKENYAVSAEYALFWAGSDTVVITPEPMDQDYVKDVTALLELDNVETLTPSTSTGFLCADLLGDKDNRKKLREMLGKERPNISTWGATKQVYQLLHKLHKENNLLVSSVDVPQEADYWVSEFFDSKVGSKTLMSSIASEIDYFDVPFSIPIWQTERLSDILLTMLRSYANVVVKANFGHGGRQVIPVSHPSDFDINTIMKNDSYWCFRPIVVEEFLVPSDTEFYPIVSFDGWISPDGVCYAKGVAISDIANGRNYLGLEIGKDTIHPNLAHATNELGLAIAHKMSLMGMRGWFDIDMLYIPNKQKLIGLEINTRRNGGTHVIRIGEALFGANWYQKAVLISLDKLYTNSNIQGYSDIRDSILKINSDYKRNSSGVVPLLTKGLSMRQPYFGYVVFSKDRKLAYEIKDKIHNLFEA